MTVKQHHIDEAKRRLERAYTNDHIITVVAEALASDRFEPPTQDDIDRKLALEVVKGLPTTEVTPDITAFVLPMTAILAGIRAADKRAGRAS